MFWERLWAVSLPPRATTIASCRDLRGDRLLCFRQVAADEEPHQRKGKGSDARPAFQRENGTVTAFNASSLSDGAAALVLM